MPKSVAGCVGLSVVAIFVALGALARADEPKCNGPQAKVQHEVGIPLLTKVPYVGKLFKKVTVVNHEAEASPAEHSIFQFEIGLAGPAACEACPAVGKAIACGKDGCQVRPIKIAGPDAASHCAADCQCGGQCACGEQCSCAAECPVAKLAVCKCGAGCAATHTRTAIHHHHAHWEQIVELTAAAAAAEARLEASEQTVEITHDALEALSELAAEKAGLTARLEAQIEHGKLAETLMELAVENARLKAQVELAEAKAAVMQQTVEMAVENERLKMRIADLEHHRAEGKAARTAAKPRLEKKAR